MIPRLYSEMEFHDRNWESALSYLEAHLESAHHIRSVKLQTHQPHGMNLKFPIAALAMVIQRAHSLRQFVWDLPWHMTEELWSALLLR